MAISTSANPKKGSIGVTSCCMMASRKPHSAIASASAQLINETSRIFLAPEAERGSRAPHRAGCRLKPLGEAPPAEHHSDGDQHQQAGEQPA